MAAIRLSSTGNRLPLDSCLAQSVPQTFITRSSGAKSLEEVPVSAQTSNRVNHLSISFRCLPGASRPILANARWQNPGVELLSHEDSVIHPDTNFLIDALVPTNKPSSLLTAWIERGEPLGISTVAWEEFLCGPGTEKAVSSSRLILPLVENLTGEDAELAEVLFNKTGRRSKSYADCCNAAVAISRNASLASGNRYDFEPMMAFGLQLL